MNKKEILTNNVDDLKKGYELAQRTNNDFLKDYISSQMELLKISATSNIYSNNDLAETYSIDLSLFIKISRIIEDNDMMNYFKHRLSDLCNLFPKLQQDINLTSLI